MFWKVTFILLFAYFSNGEATETSDTVESSGSSFQTLAGVLLVISMIALLALCADNNVQPGNPIPNWVLAIVPDPALDTGFTATSDGIHIVNRNCLHRHRRGTYETDGARWGAALSKGKHVFEIYWPSLLRGTSATVGVGTADAPLFVKPKASLVGCNGHSWGLDIGRKRLLHRGEILGTMPRGGVVPDKFFMYVDCDSGKLGYGTEFAYWGAPVSIPLSKFPVYAMIGSMCENSQITMVYRGSECANAIPGTITMVTMPTAPPPPMPTAPPPQVQVAVVNHNEMPPPFVSEMPPPPYDHTQGGGADNEKSETYVAPVKVSGI